MLFPRGPPGSKRKLAASASTPSVLEVHNKYVYVFIYIYTHTYMSLSLSLHIYIYIHIHRDF